MISVVLPVYNQVQWVRESIKCMLRQTYQDFELIIVDDGSTDGSTEVLKEFANRDARIFYHRKDNGGTGSALNLGFSHAKGEYGTWISSDNLYNPSMLTVLHTVLREHPECGLVFSPFTLDYSQDPDRKTIGRKVCSTYYIPGGVTGILEDFIPRSLTKCITGICYLFRMDLKRECGDYVECPGEDYLMGVRMGLKSKVYYLRSGPLGVWRSHPDCITVKARHIENLCVDSVLGITTNQMVVNLINTGHV